MFHLGEKISSAIQHPLSFFSNPPPLPDAHGVGPTFDWSMPTPEHVNWPGGSTSSRAPSRPVSTNPAFTLPTPPSSRSTSSSLRSRFLPSAQRRAHPYARPSVPTQSHDRSSSRPPLDPMFDWSSVSPPMPSLSRVQMATPLVSSPRTVSPYQTPRPPFSTPAASIAVGASRAVALPFPIFKTTPSTPTATMVQPQPTPSARPTSGYKIDTAAIPRPRTNPPPPVPTATIHIYSPRPQMHPASIVPSIAAPWSMANPPVPASTAAIPSYSPGPQPQLPPSAPSFGYATPAVAASQPITNPPALVSTTAVSIDSPRTQSRSAPDFVSPRAPWSGPQVQYDVGSEAGARNSPSIFGRPNGLLATPGMPTSGGRVIPTVQPTRAVTEGKHKYQRPLFLPESPPPVETPTPLPHKRNDNRNIYPIVPAASATPAPATPVPTSITHTVPLAMPMATRADPTFIPVQQSLPNQPHAVTDTRNHLRSETGDVDDELWAAAYGVEIRDTGFQSYTTMQSEQPVGSASKSKGAKSPRQVLHSAYNRSWLIQNHSLGRKRYLPIRNGGKGGPGGALRFGSKPEGYIEDVARLARWSYSENGTADHDARERRIGDIHFSPALDYDDEPFMSWVCTLSEEGVPRWIRFRAGQPHPQYEGYVFRPAQLPRLAPRWLKESSYKSTQL